MNSYKNTGIKDIISEFPKVGDILEEYGIGCGPCTVGICALKDILDIHTLDPEKEVELMARIEAVIYPDRDTAQVKPILTVPPEEKPHVFSAPMQLLVDEHTVIKRWLALIPSVIDGLDLSLEEDFKIITEGIDLIRSFADRLHHAKEEDILFKYFDDSEKIFQVIYEDHRIARSHVKEMLVALETKDALSLSEHLSAYGNLLTEHIKKEDEILFPWLDRKLTSDQVDEIARKFDEEGARLGIDSQKYISFLSWLEERNRN